jgi:hypothetical protein
MTKHTSIQDVEVLSGFDFLSTTQSSTAAIGIARLRMPSRTCVVPPKESGSRSASLSEW